MIPPWCDFLGALGGPSLSAAPNCLDAAQSGCARAKPSWSAHSGETVRVERRVPPLRFPAKSIQISRSQPLSRKGVFINIEGQITSHQNRYCPSRLVSKYCTSFEPDRPNKR